jgi:WD40 repeat protein
MTPDGRRAVSGSWHNTLVVWDLDNGKAIRSLGLNEGDPLTELVTDVLAMRTGLSVQTLRDQLHEPNARITRDFNIVDDRGTAFRPTPHHDVAP